MAVQSLPTLAGSAPPKPQTAGNELRNLDVLRAFAVLVVAGSHLYRYSGFAPRFAAFVDNLGVGGVLFFFVHTALVLLLSMQRMKTNKLTLSFYIRRAFRIYPLCWTCIILVLTTGLTDVAHEKIVQMGWHGIAVNLLLVQNAIRYPNVEMPLWSLPWEVQMYLLLPACFFLFQRYRRKALPVALWAGATALAMIVTTLPTPRAFHAAIFPPMFIGGMIAFRLLREPHMKLPSFLWPLGVVVLMFARGWLLDGILIDTARNATVNALTCLVLGLGIPFFSEVKSRWVSLVGALHRQILLWHLPASHSGSSAGVWSLSKPAAFG